MKNSNKITNEQINAQLKTEDYTNLKNKGYTKAEIIAIWNRDEQREAVQSLGDFMRAHY